MQLLPGRPGAPLPPALPLLPTPTPSPAPQSTHVPRDPAPAPPSAGRSRPRDKGRCEILAPLHCAAQGGRATGPDPSLQPVVAQRVWNKSPLHQNASPLAETAVCSCPNRHKGLHPAAHLHTACRSTPSSTGAFPSDQLSLSQLKKTKAFCTVLPLLQHSHTLRIKIWFRLFFKTDTLQSSKIKN